MLDKINASSFGRKAFVFAVGFLLMFFVSRLSAAEVLLALTSVFVLVQRVREGEWPARSFANPLVRQVLIFIFISLLGYIVADLYRGSEFKDLAAGWGRFIFLGINFVALICLLGQHWSNLWLLVAGQAVGGVVALFTVAAAPDDWWKFGFALPVTYGLLALLDKRPRALLGVVLVALGIVHIFMAFRSLGTACFVAGILIFIPKMSRKSRKLALGGGLAVTALALTFVFSAAGFNEDEGRSQGSNDNRMDQLAAGWSAFTESPVIGHGSRLVKTGVMERYYAERALRTRDKRVTTEEDESEKSLHTQVLTALAEGGFFGGAFFFLYGLILLRGLQLAAMNEFVHRPIVLVFLVLGAFDFWMSPFSTTARFEIALYCATSVTLIVAMKGGELGVGRRLLKLFSVFRGVRKTVARS